MTLSIVLLLTAIGSLGSAVALLPNQYPTNVHEQTLRFRIGRVLFAVGSVLFVLALINMVNLP